MSFRARKGNYISERRGRYYYRRSVPSEAQEALGKKVIMIPLKGMNQTERAREAASHALRDDRRFNYCYENPIQPEDLEDVVEMRIELAPPDSPWPPDSRVVYHQGEFREITNYSITNSPEHF